MLVGFTALVNFLIHAITMRSHMIFESIGEIDSPMAAMVVYSDPKELPATLSIGTQKAFEGGYEYKYRFAEEINVCV